MTPWRAVEESSAQRWRRRLVTIPMYLTMAVVVTALVPILLPLTALLDVARGARWALSRTILFFVLYLSCEVFGIVSSLLAWRPRSRWNEAFENRHYALQAAWAKALFHGGERVFGFRLDEENPEAVGSGPLLVLIRHASTADTPLPVVLLNVRHGLRMRYVLKRELLWDPSLDLVGQRIPNVFVRRASDDGQREAALVATLAQGLGPRDGLLIYPEGTRFTPVKLERALAAIAQSADPTRLARVQGFRQVLPPRLRGVLALLAAAPGVDVLVMAHTGFEGVGSFNDFWTGKLIGRRVRVHYWRIPRAQVPTDPAEQAAWVDAQWQRIDDWIVAANAPSSTPAPTVAVSSETAHGI